jgi:hypothetical protein
MTALAPICERRSAAASCAQAWIAHILVSMLGGPIIPSLLEGDAARLAGNRAQIHAFVNIGSR